MENYSYPSYPDSGDSSPRSREVEFENPPPWDEQQPPPNYKAKFMCSYGGKIQPRSHDNQLSYVGGETKILAVDLNIKFSSMISKLSAICDGADVTFKYQLPGEELDALISVTNDDDLEHMMHEYDRLYRASAKPARMRLFIFPINNSQPASFGKPAPVPGGNVDYLFGLEKGIHPAQPPPAAVKFHDPVPGPVVPPPEYQIRGVPERAIGSDPMVNPIEIQRQFQRMQIGEHDQPVYRRKSEDNIAGGYAAGDYYAQKFSEKAPPSNLPAAVPHTGGYWSEKQVSSEGFPPTTASNGAGGADHQVYVIPSQGTFYHAPPVVRPPAAPATQGYYTVQRMVSDGYREQPVYSAAPPPRAPFSSAAPATLAPPQPVKSSPYAEGFSVVRPPGMPDNSAAYAQVAYDSAAGRQFYYTAPGGGMVHPPPYQGVAPAVGADIRPVGVSLGQDLKVVNKVSQGSV
ncbi:leucine-rich repeat extensin-like protein 2 [Senna tora]|uniref:Leucine-rich repeat extensin-like protein 2 n=1 Tax=Senna tora TaxID=362788 RepID=A0A834VZV8_9FABA|nr:leucine-rich repeat extensin-like protein 2 [Senna tora]